MKLLIAPNAFKNSLDATKVAEAIAAGLQKKDPSLNIVSFPIADGGDGTGLLLAKHLHAQEKIAKVKDPIGRDIVASYWIKDSTAFIELANASGLRLLNKDEYDPLHATTFGTGQLMMNAIDAGVNSIVLCIGGSATVDAGLGILRAMGFKFLDKDQNEILSSDSLIYLSEYKEPSQSYKDIKIKILCDVANPLVGANGSAAVFGPQKGADEKMIHILDKGFERLSDIVYKQQSKSIAAIKHGGASGGVAAGLFGILDAELENGIDYFLQLTNFDSLIADADILITGEGSLDHQTLQGKAPFGVAVRAKQKGMRVIGLAGSIPQRDKPALEKYFDELVEINQPGDTVSESMNKTYQNLEQAVGSLKLE